MEFLKKHGLLSMAIGIIISLITWMYAKTFDKGKREAEVESRLFKSVDYRIKTENIIDASLTPQQIADKNYRDSINDVSKNKSRHLRDSMFIIAQRRDSLTAVTIYQFKESQEKQQVQIQRLIDNN